MQEIQSTAVGDKIIENLDVKVLSFLQLFDRTVAKPLSIPLFQRPYVWNNTRVSELLDDLVDYTNNDYIKGLPYYLGTLLVYNSASDSWDIVDGQQRVTTLLLLYKSLNNGADSLPSQSLKYDEANSGKAIATAYKSLKNAHHLAELGKISDLFSRITFTVVATNNLDIAFSLFDSQNSRGIKPDTADILKAYHLRSILDSKLTQEYWASKWENMQASERIVPGHQSSDDAFLLPFIATVLWRARNWKGTKKLPFETPELIEREFSKNKKPLKSASLSLRYPLTDGEHFFKYLQQQVHNISLLTGPNADHEPNPELSEFRDFYFQVYSGVSAYMGQFFLLCSALYYDKFKHEGLHSFALWLDYLIGTLRLTQRIMKTTFTKNVLTNYSENLLDVILLANEPFEVLNFFKEGSVEQIDESTIKPHTVAGKYLHNIRSYYNMENKGSINDKKTWINDKLKKAYVGY